MTETETSLALLPGFEDPVLESQATFRRILDAIARPGRIEALPKAPPGPEPLYPTTTAVGLTLWDFDTALWLDPEARGFPAMVEFLRFHCGCPIVERPDEADFALVVSPVTMPALSAFRQGSDDFPDRSTTIVTQVRSFESRVGVSLSGPGIAAHTAFDAAPLPLDFWPELRANRERFPRGVDVILTSPDALAALPRSVRVNEREG